MKNKYDLSSLGGVPASGQQIKKKNKQDDNQYDLSGLGAVPAGKQKTSSETRGWSGVLQDAIAKAGTTLQGIPGALMALPGEFKGAGQQIMGEPAQEQMNLGQNTQEAAHNMMQAPLGIEPNRAMRNMGAGLAQLGHGVLSAPGNIRDYLVQKELASKEAPSMRLPEEILPKEFNYPEAMGVQGHQPGDALLQSIASNLALPGEIAAIRQIPGLRSGARHQLALNEIEQNIAKTNEGAAQYLGEGQEHAARASQQFLDTIEGRMNPETGKREGGLRKEIGSQYDQLANDMSKERVQIASSPDLKSIQAEIRKLGKGVTGEDKEKLLKMLTSADSKLESVSGADALTSYRELKRQRNKANQKAHTEGIGPKEHEEWIKKAEELGSIETRMKEMLEKQIGGEYLERLRVTDKAYSTQIAPLSENRMYQDMRDHGQTAKNIMKYLQGTTRGNQTLNAIMAQNPELQRVIVGQKYASAPGKLANAGEIMKPYERLNPEISKFVDLMRNNERLKADLAPKLEAKAKKYENRKGFRNGLGVAGLGAAGITAGNAMLGENWKEDVPLLTNLMAVLKLNKMSRR